MYLKCIVIVCAVYFITLVWSTGLNSDQLKLLAGLYENTELSINEITDENITQFIKEHFGIEQLTNIFRCDPNVPELINLNDLLMVLAKNDNKNADKTKVKNLTPTEVEHYLGEFIAHTEIHNQPGYLTPRQLQGLFKSLNLKDALEALPNEIKIKKGGNYVMNGADFLFIMLAIKPEGNGLTLAQLEKFVSLYEAHSIDPVASQKIFEELGITTKEHELNLLFKHDRPAEKLLIDIIVYAAERSRTVEKNESRLLDQSEVVSCVSNFNMLDENEDGLLSGDECAFFVEKLKTVLELMTKGSVKDSLTFEKAQIFLKKFDGSDGNLN
ncbi:uncharacterized protein LOC126841281 [Adelges cooleyi]|uniref:uncharacterized protein LOC126841281 n=1 Tax=Adelges cooleyi TaxID=133065 RepID=UPI00217F7E09|nr:uncharacterized protein LOC126841281 [Adelges cooleyi]